MRTVVYTYTQREREREVALVCPTQILTRWMNNKIKHNILTLRLLLSYIYGAPILDVSRSYTTTHHSR